MNGDFKVTERLAGRLVETGDGQKVEVFPHRTSFTFDRNTIIADLSKTSRNYRYKVVTVLEDGRVKSFDCSDVVKLDNDNYKLRLKEDYEGVERSFIYNPYTGQAVSRVYDGMSELSGDGTFLCTINVDKRSCKFYYLLKIDTTGKVVSDVLNSETEETIPYNKLEYDEINTINLITENSRKIFIKGYELPKKVLETPINDRVKKM